MILLLCARSADAQDRPEGSTVNGRFSIEETNDKFAFDSDDAQFTQGLKVRATWDPRWIDSPVTTCLYEPYRRRFEPNRITASFELGQDIFTPDDISPFDEDDERIDAGREPLSPEGKEAEFDEWYDGEFKHDRPYSSETYGEYKLNGYFTRHPWAWLGWEMPGMLRWSIAGRAGYVGPTGGGQVQKAVHVLMRGVTGEHYPRDPQGWEFQQRENGFSRIRNTEIAPQVGVNASFEAELDLYNAKWTSWLHARGSGLTFSEIGQFRDLGGIGLRAELGYLGKQPLACFPSADRQQIPPECSNWDGPEVGGNVSTFAFYVYGEGRGRFNLYNRHLDNEMFTDDAVEARRRWTDAEGTLGVVLRFWTFELEFAQTAFVRSTRIDPRDDIDHYVGTIKVSALF
ncbi:MAG TPA: lipid A-modifier LpxR family protein [Kofleriaceae bacterium]|nr:lipid A-modifier LpxR family protein [Kofleriaceae bacterium]